MREDKRTDQTFECPRHRSRVSCLDRRRTRRSTAHLSSELALQVRFDEARPREIFRDETTLVRLTHHNKQTTITTGEEGPPYPKGKEEKELI